MPWPGGHDKPVPKLMVRPVAAEHLGRRAGRHRLGRKPRAWRHSNWAASDCVAAKAATHDS
jgi:hypothetical protein